MINTYSYINHVNMIQILLQVLYLVRDEKFPADKDILLRTERELKYCAEYINRTGIHW